MCETARENSCGTVSGCGSACTAARLASLCAAGGVG